MSTCRSCGASVQRAGELFCPVHAPSSTSDESVLIQAPTQVVAVPVLDPADSALAQAPTRVAPIPGARRGPIGRVLGDRFELKTFLGSGGFGSTYVALDRRLRRECVVKVLRSLSDPPTPLELEMRQRFANEAVALAHLAHPNVVQAYDHGEEPDGTAWIAMEFARGRSLAELLDGGQKLAVTQATDIARQVAGALAFAHARGIVHRDLKPDNLILVEGTAGGEVVKVLDFGIARIIDPSRLGLNAAEAQVTQMGSFFGTPAYMSPEQASGEAVGTESDVYALGVMLYRMLTGVLPGTVPPSWNPLTTIHYVTSDPQPLRKLRPECPAGVADLVHRMLAKRAADRVVTAGQVYEALQSTPTQSGAVVAPPAAPAPSRMGVVIGAVVAFAIVGAGAFVVLRPAPKPSAAPAYDPAAARDRAIADLLRRARAGEPVASVEGAALELLKGGSDARLSLARGLVLLNTQKHGLAMGYFEEARVLGEGTPLATEAATLFAETRQRMEQAEAAARAEAEAARLAAEQAAKAAAAPKPVKKPDEEKDREDFPDY